MAFAEHLRTTATPDNATAFSFFQDEHASISFADPAYDSPAHPHFFLPHGEPHRHDGSDFFNDLHADLNAAQLPDQASLALHPEAAPFVPPPPPELPTTPSPTAAEPAVDARSSVAPETANSPRRPDDPDNTCRPRLTPEQTAFLEEYYAHTPRPTTQQKKQHALQLGLTQEKVNNWFQNRRAKTKQQARTRRDFEVLPIRERSMNAIGNFRLNGLPMGMMPSAASRTHSVDSHLGMHSSHPPPGLLADHDRRHSNWLHSLEQFSVPNEVQRRSTVVDPTNVASSLSPGMHPDMLPRSQSIAVVQDIHATPRFHLPDWLPPTHDSSPVTTPRGASHLEPPHTGLSASLSETNLLSTLSASTMEQLQMEHEHAASVPPSFPPHSTPAQDSDEHIAAMLDARPTSSPFQPSSGLSPKLSADSGNVFLTSAAMADDLSRRPSLASELAHNMDGIHLQRPSQPPSDEEVLKATNLAARRKRRPAALLATNRTVSASQLPSPTGRDAPMPRSLRKMKSLGHGLGMNSGRITKLAGPAAQKSPLSISTFQEAGALNRFQASASGLSSEVSGPFEAEVTTMDGGAEPEQSTTIPGQQNHPSPPGPENVLSTSPSDSMPAPPLSASYTQQSFEGGSHAPSPPFTPFMPHNQWLAAAAAAAGNYDFSVPQSAPAQINTFPNFSPPMMPQNPGTPGFYPTQPHSFSPAGSDSYFEGSNGGLGQSMLSSNGRYPGEFTLNGRGKFAEYDGSVPPPLPSHMQQHVFSPSATPSNGILRSGLQSPASVPSSLSPGGMTGANGQPLTPSAPPSVAAGQFNFFAAPPPAPKELEVVMATFPTPPDNKTPTSTAMGNGSSVKTGQAAGPSSIRLPQQFTFQNSGPQDYAEAKT